MTTTTFQSSGVSDASIINGGYADTNYESATTIYSGESNAATSLIHRALIKFAGLSDGTITPPVTVSSATLSFYLREDLSSNVRTKRVYRVKRTVVMNQVTWNVFSTGNSWSTAGCGDSTDRETSNIGNASFSAEETLNAWKDITLNTDAIAEMINGAFANNGFIVITDAEGADCYGFYSANYAISNYRPKLVITHTPATTYFIPHNIFLSKRLNWNWWKRGGIWMPNNPGLVTI